MASQTSKKAANRVKQEQLRDLFTKAIASLPENPFCILNAKDIDNIRNHPMWTSIDESVSDIFKSVLARIDPDKILMIEGSVFPFAEEAGETKGEVAVESDEKVAAAAAAPNPFGFYALNVDDVFGNNIIGTYATKGYRFYSRRTMDDLTGAQQAANRICLQQHLKARYVWGTDLRADGTLAPLTGSEAVLNDLTPHVVFTINNIRAPEIRAKVDAFFKSAPHAIAVLDVDADTEGVSRSFTLPASIKNLVVTTTTSSLRSLGLAFLSQSKIENIWFKDLENVTSVGHSFLIQSYELRTISLEGLSNVTSVGNFFLSFCTGLTAIDLRPLSKVTSIGDCFLYECDGFTAIDLKGLSNVTSVGKAFLSRNTKFTAIDLSPLSKITSIGNFFLCGGRRLTEINLSPLSKVTSIGDYFLSGSIKLTAIDLSPLSNLARVGGYFLSECTGITAIDLRPLSNVTSVGNGFLYFCIGLTAIDLSPLSNLARVGERFLHRCPSLSHILDEINHQVVTDNSDLGILMAEKVKSYIRTLSSAPTSGISPTIVHPDGRPAREE